MANITLSEIRQRCRERADMESSEFITDDELNFYINQSIAELHDLIIQSYGSDYYVKSSEFSTTNQQDTYNLSTIITDDDFYKLRGIDAQIDSDDWYTLSQFNFNERNRNQNLGIWDYLGLAGVKYRLVGETVIFTPVPDRSLNVKVWYIPRAVTLSSDSDTYNDFNGWIQYVIVDCAIKMKSKEESDVSILLNEKMLLKRRIEEVANNRDSGDSESIQDVSHQIDEY